MDDLLTSFGTNKDAQCKMNFDEVMTALIVQALFFCGNFSKARLKLKSHNYIKITLRDVLRKYISFKGLSAKGR